MDIALPGPASIAFWFFAVLAVIGGLGVVLSREPIRNVLSLVVVMLSLAIEFLLLSAQFVFVVQVIVYAGAVMVLFLFVIALLGPVREQPTYRLPWHWVVTAVVVAVFAGFLVSMLRAVDFAKPQQADMASFGSVQSIGYGLFTTYLYPFELTSLLLLVAAVGAIYLSRRDRGTLPARGAGGDREPEPGGTTEVLPK